MKQRPQYIIRDWAGNKPFGEKTFKDFDDAWDCIYRAIEQRYGIPCSDEQEKAFDVECGEYYVEEL